MTGPARLGIGLPNVLQGASGDLVVAWARRAEECGFSFVSTIGRLAYPSHDDLISLAAAAGATQRVGLVTNVLLAPLIPDALLAKSALTLSHVSGGRLTLGVGLGARELDYMAAGAEHRGRGTRLDRQLDVLHRAGRGEAVAAGHPVGTAAPGTDGIPLLIGGYGEQAVRRTVRWGVGWTGANGGRDRNGPVLKAITTAWDEAGRRGRPRFLALSYFVLGGDRAAETGRANVADYYSFFGKERSAGIAREVVTSPSEIRKVIESAVETGFTDITLTPCVPDLQQVELLADVLR